MAVRRISGVTKCLDDGGALISMRIRRKKTNGGCFCDTSAQFAAAPPACEWKIMIMMTAVHLWLLAPSPRATLQRFLKRLPAALERHTDCMAKCFLGGFNQCHLHMLDKSNPHQGGGSPPEAHSCPFAALPHLYHDPLTRLILTGSFQRTATHGGWGGGDSTLRRGTRPNKVRGE